LRLFESLWVDAVVVTHDVVDYTWNWFNNIRVINIWHGMPVKPIGYKSEIERRWLNAKTDSYYNSRFDILILSSEEHIDVFCESWKIDKKKIRLAQSWQSQYLQKTDTVKYIFAPTFGVDNVLSFEAIILCRDVIVCPHPNDDTFKSYLVNNNIKYYDFSNVVNAGDVIITNHSSIVYDFCDTNHVVLIKEVLFIQGIDYYDFSKLPDKVRILNSIEEIMQADFCEVSFCNNRLSPASLIISDYLCD